MAKLEDVFAQEWDRENPAEWSKIHLYKMGDFWRAYEWSAWLISVISYNDNVRMTTKDRKPLHVTRMSHTASYNLRRSMFGEGEFSELIEYDADMRKGWLAA